MFLGLRASVADLMRRSIMGLAGAILIAVALGFFTSAGWYALSVAYGPVIAGCILGAVFLLLGLILLLVARDPHVPPQIRYQAEPPMGRVVTAFLGGMAAGSRSRRRPPE